MARGSASQEQPKPIFEITMDTNAVIRGELFPASAPNTVGNFISLANGGFYDGLDFHRCISGFIIQGGRPEEPLPYCIRGEFEFAGDKRNRLPHEYGSLCMSRANHYDSASSQFFIVVMREAKELRYLDGAYAVFGRVTEGMRTVEAISQLKTDELNAPLNRQTIRRVRVETFGADYPFEKIAPPAAYVNIPSANRRFRDENEPRP